jgi:hypothetical protein
MGKRNYMIVSMMAIRPTGIFRCKPASQVAYDIEG